MIIFVLSLIVAFRGNTADTVGYIEIFYDSLISSKSYIGERYSFESSYYFLSNISGFFIKSHILFFFIYSFLSLYFIFLNSVLFKINFNYAILFYITTYFVAYQFSHIRQGLGLSITYFFLTYIYSLQRLKKIIFYILLSVVIVLNIHLVSLAPLLLISFFRLVLFFLPSKFDRHIILFSLFLVFSIFSICFIMYLNLLDLFNFINYDKLLFYYYDDEYSSPSKFLSLAMIKSILSFFLVLIIFKRQTLNRNFLYLLLFTYCTQLSIRLAFLDSAILTGRLGASFAFIDFLLFTTFIMGSFKNKIYNFIFFIFIFLISFFIMFLHYPNFFEDYFASNGY